MKKIYVFDIKLRLGVLRGHFVRNKSNFLNALGILKALGGPILPEVIIENRLSTLKSFELSLKSCKVHNLLQPFEVSNYYLFTISSPHNKKMPVGG